MCVCGRLNEFGYRVGSRVLELLAWREKVAKREIKVINVLYFIHSTVWKALFGKQADSLEKSTENEDECKMGYSTSTTYGSDRDV